MLEDLNTAIDVYTAKWQQVVAERNNKRFFEQLKPTAVGWKTEDLAEYDRLFNELREVSDQIHIAWLNNRWLATMHLREQRLGLGIEVVKLMQRRPGSSDATKLDHIDFLIPENVDPKVILGAEAGLNWTDEKNGDFCKWISIWFDSTEAKLRVDTTVDVAIAELQAVNKKILGR